MLKDTDLNFAHKILKIVHVFMLERKNFFTYSTLHEVKMMWLPKKGIGIKFYSRNNNREKVEEIDTYLYNIRIIKFNNFKKNNHFKYPY